MKNIIYLTLLVVVLIVCIIQIILSVIGTPTQIILITNINLISWITLHFLK
jgi:hypothetical protein